ncbi:hypothetical protein N7532_009182 [Penicillium argentinense]|uniref:THO complex subunit Tho1 n=1 Tax=Penicillium argentinense TaxID=1131581 RepID=A0A9W9EYV4_9EURO|nr:uncharacterized protein N7532_009182 [Penicillium argentinense]KAJ5090498.1 hypothetical protein N7532_009182 [Penicillium argentinense]
MAPVEVAAVRVYKRLIDWLLDRAAQAKPDGQIEPPLTEATLGDSIWKVPEEDQHAVQHLQPQTRFAAVEIAFREKFYHLLASTSIHDPSFIHIWNLLDIISIFSDNEQCEPGLIFWLTEELLDSQTIDKCRPVFEYLESRRERNIKKHFKQKSLVILRFCNELLRRLSRAEDTVFCGRVFIFLFQSFPLGDKSSVNLRGEFHTENVTTFDEPTKPAVENDDADTTMTEGNEDSTTEGQAEEASTPQNRDAGSTPAGKPQIPKVVVSRRKDEKSEKPVDLDTLYPMFWSLQAYFSSPTKTFDPEHFESFKTYLEATLSAFKKMRPDLDTQTSQRSSEEARNSHKRKREAEEGEVESSFNPKYLTSRELFDLEINDMAFRRHVLVQALILLDFMLSLTPDAKTRFANLTNKSVLYGFVLSEHDAKWAAGMRNKIEQYLRDGTSMSGNFYYRMVATVLSRDKNWSQWKAEGCPPIEKPAVAATEEVEARANINKAYPNKKIRSTPMGSLDLTFLSDAQALANTERLKETERYSVPTADSVMMSMLDDDMDIDMAQSQEEKEAALKSKASKTWRMLRLTVKNKFAAFNKIDDGKNLNALFERTGEANEPAEATANEPEPTEPTEPAKHSEPAEHTESPKSTDDTQPAEEAGATEPTEKTLETPEDTVDAGEKNVPAEDQSAEDKPAEEAETPNP